MLALQCPKKPIYININMFWLYNKKHFTKDKKIENGNKEKIYSV